MTDADLIYNACLRAERRIEAHPIPEVAAAAMLAVQTLREEIGKAIAEEHR